MRGKIFRMLMNAPNYLACIEVANALHTEHKKLLMKQESHNLGSVSESKGTRAMNKHGKTITGTMKAQMVKQIPVKIQY